MWRQIIKKTKRCLKILSNNSTLIIERVDASGHLDKGEKLFAHTNAMITNPQTHGS